MSGSSGASSIRLAATRSSAAVREGGWKLIHWIENDSVELFNIANDPGEAMAYSAQYPNRVKDLRARIEKWRKETGANMPKAKL